MSYCFRILLLALCVSFLLPGSYLTAAAQLAQSDLEIGLPPGWRQHSVLDDGTIALVHTSGMNVLFANPRPYNGQPETAMRAFVQSMTSSVDIEDFDFRSGLTESGIEAVYDSGFAEFGDNRVFILPVGLIGGRRIYPIVMVETRGGYPEDEIPYFGELLAALNLPGADAGPFNGPGDTKLDGVYAGFGAQTVVTAAATVGIGYGTYAYHFLPDGRVVTDEDGLGDPQAWCRTDKEDCRRYRIHDGLITIGRSASNLSRSLRITHVETEPFGKLPNDGIRIGGMDLVPIPPSDGMKLDGHYKATSGGTTPDQRFSAYGETDFEFRPDGRFVKGGSFASIGNYNSVGITTSNKHGPRPGRYRIDSYTLTLAYDDGETEQFSFLPYQDILSIDGDTYFQPD